MNPFKKNLGMLVMGAVLFLGCAADKQAEPPDADTNVNTDSDTDTHGTFSGKWSMGYYAGWKSDQYPIDKIEWSGLTHIAMAFYLPTSDGSLSLLSGNPAVATSLVTAAHANSVSAVASIGGADSEVGFQQATSAESMDAFIDNLLALADTYGYDGFDIDWEPMAASDQATAADIAQRIRTKRPGMLMTIPIGAVNVNLGEDLTGFAAIAASYDQLNIMSYGLSGAWQGWQSWHSSPLYHSLSSTPLSIDSSVALYLAAGVKAEQLGVGIGFYGLCYGPPVTAPEQDLNGSVVLASDSAISYAEIMTRYFNADAYFFDDFAKVPYLSFAEPTGPAGCTYISYDDERSVAEKGNYIKNNGLGGVIIWELNEGFLTDAAPGTGNPMLEAVRDTILR